MAGEPIAMQQSKSGALPQRGTPVPALDLDIRGATAPKGEIAAPPPTEPTGGVSDAPQDPARNDVQAASQGEGNDSGTDANTAVRLKSSTRSAASHAPRKKMDVPGPGRYMWDDHVNMKRKPTWSMTSPERKHLDLMLGTWTPASGSLQPRAPDPGEYEPTKPVGRNGLVNAPRWTWEKGERPCLAADPPEKIELEHNLPSYMCGQHPGSRTTPHWSLFGKDRRNLPADLPTWTPKMSTDIRPGPGQYDLDRVGKRWKSATTRRGCQWGGRGASLHPEVRAWVPRTKGSVGISGGEMIRLSIYPNKGSPMRRCGCLVCPGPCNCNDDSSPRSRRARGFAVAVPNARSQSMSSIRT
mmetsp:Transcript_21013/g.58689  ORF Transcript_21013/g.58689 Transcript_21013/m.58689 type:complete len:355 (+) Transcript_21013:69-1133(+)